MSDHAVDEGKLHAFLGKMVTEMGAAATGVLVLLGDQLGLYKAMDRAGRVKPADLARTTGTAPRYVEEWLANQAASGYIEYDAKTGEFYLTPEQRMVFADEDSPFFMTGGFYAIASLFKDHDKLDRLFRSGEGMGWGDHHPILFDGTAKFFRPSYKAHLVQEWIPALEGVQEKLTAGGKVADVGCGHGISTLIMAEAFPKASFVGYDFHPPSVEAAGRLVEKSGRDNVRFEVATAKDFPGGEYDLVTFFDCLHDMGDPAGAAAHVRKSLAKGGTLMIVEPMARDSLAENLNPVGRVYYAFSAVVCTPSSLSQEVGAALGAQAGEARLRKILQQGGFKHVRRAAETPFNIILEARA